MRDRWLTSVLLALMLAASAVKAADDLRLVEAVKKGDTASIRALGSRLTSTPPRETATALHWAAYLDDGDSPIR